MLNVLISYEMKLCGDVIGTTATTQNGGRTGTYITTNEVLTYETCFYKMSDKLPGN